MPAQRPMLVERALDLARVDFSPPHRQPAPTRVAAALAVSVAGSLAADATLVVIGTPTRLARATGSPACGPDRPDHPDRSDHPDRQPRPGS